MTLTSKQGTTPTSGLRLLLIGTSFRPEYGGPARSVSRLALELAATGVDVSVWAPDGSAATTRFIPEEASVRRAGGTLEDVLTAHRKIDVIHDNGIWLGHNHRIAAWARTHDLPRLVSTRGMLEPWAMRHKPLKKRLAWWLYQKRDLGYAAALHATAEREAVHVRSLLPKVPTFVIPNGIDAPPTPDRPAQVLRSLRQDGSRTALFVGRIYPVKGLPMLIHAWGRVRPPGWQMRIVGPDEAGHRDELETLIRQKGLEDAFVFTGPKEGPDLEEEYARAELFILPSHTENFGMAIGEALARSLPVITTQGTPWEQLEQQRCGWWVPASGEGIESALRDSTFMPMAELQKMGARALELSRQYSWTGVAAQFEALYRNLAGKR